MDSLINKISDYQSEDRSEKLTSTLQDFRVEISTIQEIRNFVEKYHYSHNTNGLKVSYCFKLVLDNKIVGAIIFGLPALDSWRKYTKNQNDIIELRRLVCIDDTPKNTESYFIGYCLRWLKKHTNIKLVISYADQTYGHIGTVYKASNFRQVGFTAPGRVINFSGKHYHDKTIRTKYNGKLKPYALKVKNALENGEAIYEKTKSKVIYLYQLK